MTAVVMTGANHDGAAGLVQARQRGALAIVQDPAEAEFAAMPAAALEQLGRDPRSTHRVLRLSQIADLLLRLGRDPQAGGAVELS
jgi:two-component system, chemotaxis family, protein-glutamate methylesterase/glutaminase